MLSAGLQSTPEGRRKTTTLGDVLRGEQEQVKDCPCNLLLPLFRDSVFFLKNLRVVGDVSGDYVGDRADGHGVVAGDAAT